MERWKKPSIVLVVVHPPRASANLLLRTLRALEHANYMGDSVELRVVLPAGAIGNAEVSMAVDFFTRQFLSRGPYSTPFNFLVLDSEPQFFPALGAIRPFLSMSAVQGLFSTCQFELYVGVGVVKHVRHTDSDDAPLPYRLGCESQSSTFRGSSVLGRSA